MAKNIVVITGSPRKNGNTEILADAFIKGAKSSGNTVAKINSGNLKINGCTDCKYCFTHDGICVQRDGMDEVYPLLRKADMIVFASPVYSMALRHKLKLLLTDCT